MELPWQSSNLKQKTKSSMQLKNKARAEQGILPISSPPQRCLCAVNDFVFALCRSEGTNPENQTSTIQACRFQAAGRFWQMLVERKWIFAIPWYFRSLVDVDRCWQNCYGRPVVKQNPCGKTLVGSGRWWQLLEEQFKILSGSNTSLYFDYLAYCEYFKIYLKYFEHFWILIYSMYFICSSNPSSASESLSGTLRFFRIMWIFPFCSNILRNLLQDFAICSNMLKQMEPLKSLEESSKIPLGLLQQSSRSPQGILMDPSGVLNESLRIL